jgi:hypothetical protein
MIIILLNALYIQQHQINLDVPATQGCAAKIEGWKPFNLCAK